MDRTIIWNALPKPYREHQTVPRHIGLLIDRKDETINLCEIKFYNGPFEISKEYEEKLQNKISTFLEETKTKKSLILTFITSFGIKENKHSDIVQKQITMDDLFAQKIW